MTVRYCNGVGLDAPQAPAVSALPSPVSLDARMSIDSDAHKSGQPTISANNAVHHASTPSSQRPKLSHTYSDDQGMSLLEDWLHDRIQLEDHFDKMGIMPYYSHVWRLSRGLVLKTGPGVSPHEAGMMEFVRQNTSIPVPEVLQHGRHPTTGWTWIIMPFLDGTPLEDEWDTLSEEQLRSILSQLAGFIQDLRKEKMPMICSLEPAEGQEGKPWQPAALCDPFFSRPVGPFSDGCDDSFLKALATSVEKRGCWAGKKTQRVVAMLDGMPRRRDDGSSSPGVCTHGQLEARNVLVRDGRVVGLLDWSQAGFYPPYWEYVKASFDEEGVLERRLGEVLPEQFLLEMSVLLHARDVIF